MINPTAVESCPDNQSWCRAVGNRIEYMHKIQIAARDECDFNDGGFESSACRLLAVSLKQ